MSTPSPQPPQGENTFAAIFKNHNFRLLWVSQLFGQSAQTSIFFVQTVMMEGLTRSSGLVGLMVLIYNIPSILFSLPSGLVVDRFQKKSLLLFCNISRIFVVAGFIFFRRYAQGGGSLTAIYVLTFVVSTIGQLSDPAEVAMVPLIVPSGQLLTANSVFHLLFNVAQVLGLLFLAPLSIKLGGVDGAFAAISVTYLVTAALIWPISINEPSSDSRLIQDLWSNVWNEMRAGWQFVITNRSVLVAITQHGLMSMLSMVIAVLAPGFAARVLGMQATDAIYIFFSAGVGMFLVTMFTGNLGHHFRRETLAAVGLLIMSLALLGFAFVAWKAESAARAVTAPTQQLILQVVVMAFALGGGGTMAGVAARTIVQERTPSELRGRVITAEFLFANVFGLVPMLIISGLADVVGIGEVLFGLATLVMAAVIFSVRLDRLARREHQHAGSG